jgi:molybdopterin converting factor small subunit
MGRPVRLLFFATARTAVGRASVEWPVPDSGVPADELAREIVAAYPRLAPVLRGSRWVLNGRSLPRAGARVRPGDELALHPPYGGG